MKDFNKIFQGRFFFYLQLYWYYLSCSLIKCKMGENGGVFCLEFGFDLIEISLNKKLKFNLILSTAKTILKFFMLKIYLFFWSKSKYFKITWKIKYSTELQINKFAWNNAALFSWVYVMHLSLLTHVAWVPAEKWTIFVILLN